MLAIAPNSVAPQQAIKGGDEFTNTNNVCGVVAWLFQMALPNLTQNVTRKVQWAWTASLEQLKKEALYITIALFASCCLLGFVLTLQAAVIYSLAKFVIAAWNEKGAQSIIEDLRHQNQVLGRELDQVVRARNQFREEKEQLSNQNEQLQLDIAHGNQALVRLQGDCARLNQENTHVLADLAAERADRNNIQTQVGLLRNEINEMHGVMEALRNQNALLQEGKQRKGHEGEIGGADTVVQKVQQLLSPNGRGLLAQLLRTDSSVK